MAFFLSKAEHVEVEEKQTDINTLIFRTNCKKWKALMSVCITTHYKKKKEKEEVLVMRTDALKNQVPHRLHNHRGG